MPLGISLFGKASSKEAEEENAKELVREWQRRLRQEARDVERSIKRIEQDEDKMKRDIKKMAKEGGEPKNIQILAKSLVRSAKGKNRLYLARATMQATASELANTAATMRLSDALKNSTEVMQQMNTLVKIPEMHESMQTLGKEMMKAGLIEEIIEEGLEDIDGPELEEEAEQEVEKVLDDLAIDASLRIAVTKPQAVAASAETATTQPAAASSAPAAVGSGAM